MLDSMLVMRPETLPGNLPNPLVGDEPAVAFTPMKVGSTPPDRPFFLRVSMQASVANVGGADSVVFTLSGAHDPVGPFENIFVTPALSEAGVYNYGFVTDYEYLSLDVAVTDAGADGVNFPQVAVEITPYVRAPHDMPNR